MVPTILRYAGMLMLAIGLLVMPTDSVNAYQDSTDVFEFIAIPEPPNVQASIDLALACQNGVVFGFNAIDSVADLGDASHNWDISFATDEGNLLIKEYPLWLEESMPPLQVDAMTFPYRGFFSLLWTETVPAGPLTTCIAGAGTGFCQFQIPIDECTIEPAIVAHISQIGPGSSSSLVTDQLVYEVRAYDPQVGTANGDGIAEIEMQIIEHASGTQVYTNTIDVPAVINDGADFCALSPLCEPWDFHASDLTWPNGNAVDNGIYLLRAVVTSTEGGQTAVQEEIEIAIKSDPQVALVPASEFSMGSSTGTRSEQPVHPVEIEDFWIMRTEVTYGEYAECVRDHSCIKPHDDERWDDPDYADYPVTNVDWYDANRYAAWAGGRLPTDAEWEKACRGFAGYNYPWGDELPTDELANFNQEVGDTTPVGSYPDGASEQGLLDMSGNVWEWTSSLASDYPYDPDDGRESVASLDPRSMRGGSFFYTYVQLTCSARTGSTPETANQQIGFRLVYDRALQTKSEPSVSIVDPLDGAKVSSPFIVEFVADNLIVEPPGAINEGAGHQHILVDVDFVDSGKLIPFDDNHLHFGKGQTSIELDLEPGVHTLRLQFADGAHIALEGEEYQDEITVTVIP